MMNLKMTAVCLCMMMSFMNMAHAFPMHIETYKSKIKSSQEKSASYMKDYERGYALAKLGVDLANAALHDDYASYRKLVGASPNNTPTFIGLYFYNPRNDFEEESKNAFENLKELLNLVGIKKVELFDKNNNYAALGKSNSDSRYKSITVYWLINNERLMVPQVFAFEKDGEWKINQFLLGRASYSKENILHAEKNAQKVIQALKNGDYEAYQKSFLGNNAKKRLSARNCRELQQLLEENKYKVTLTYQCYPFFEITAFFHDPKTQKQAGIIYLYCDNQGNIVDIDNKLGAHDYKQQRLAIVDNILRTKYITGDNDAYENNLAKFAFAAAKIDFTPRDYEAAKEVFIGVHFNTNKAPLIKLVDMGINMTRAEAALYQASFADGSTQDFLFVFDDSLLQPKCVYWEAYTVNEENDIGSKLWKESEEKYKNNPDRYAWRHKVLDW